MININQFIFSRTQPQKNLEIIKSLSEAELLAITPATIICNPVPYNGSNQIA